MRPPEIDDYLALFRLYGDALDTPSEPGGQRFALLFDQVVRLLMAQSPLNSELPAPFLDVARHYRHHDPATLDHFRYDENRHFFLSDLYDLLRLKAAARRPPP